MPEPSDFEANEAFDAIVSGTPNRWTQLLTGVISVEDLDDEELVRGQTRGKDGKFHGAGPKNVPRAMHKEIQKRLSQRGLQKVQASFFDAIDTVTGIMQDTELDAGVRLKAATYIIERIAGKTPDKVEMTMEVKKYETVMEGIFKPVVVQPDEKGVYVVPDQRRDAEAE